MERVRVIVRGLKTFAQADEDSISEIDVGHAIELVIQMATGEIKHRRR